MLNLEEQENSFQIYQREYNGEHFVIGADHDYNDDDVAIFNNINKIMHNAKYIEFENLK